MSDSTAQENLEELINKFWELSYERNPKIEIEPSMNPVDNIMNQLADLAFQCMSHYVRLSIYQDDLNSAIDIVSEKVETSEQKFTTTMPRVED